MRLYFIAPLVLVLVACAAPEPEPVVALSDPNATTPDMECHQETSMGSNVIHKVCTRKQTAAERNETQEVLRNMPPNNSIAHPAAGSQSH